MTDPHDADEQAERQAQIDEGIRRLFDRYRRTGELENELPRRLSPVISLPPARPAPDSRRRSPPAGA